MGVYKTNFQKKLNMHLVIFWIGILFLLKFSVLLLLAVKKIVCV